MSEQITAEEFFRNKFLQLHPGKRTITLHQETISGELAMRWAHEFASLPPLESRIRAKLAETSDELSEFNEIEDGPNYISNSADRRRKRKLIDRKILLRELLGE